MAGGVQPSDGEILRSVRPIVDAPARFFLRPAARLGQATRGLVAASFDSGQVVVNKVAPGFLRFAGEQLLHRTGPTHHWVSLTQRPERNFVFDTDPAMAVAARRKVLDMAAFARLRVSGTHMPLPGFGRFEKVGDAYRWNIEPWIY